MAFAVSPTRTVLWDQIQYAGSPASFAWVLPVGAGAYIEVSNDAWFETLDAATTAQIVSPSLSCDTPASFNSGCGCGSEDFGGGSSGGPDNYNGIPPVTVVHQGTGGGGASAGVGGGAGGSCTVSTDQIDGSSFACGALDDVEAALIGMHPGSVWITRLEAMLPHAALATDLDIQAAAHQTTIDNWFVATKTTNAPCATAGATSALGGGGRAARGERALLIAGAGLLAAAIARRRQRTVLAVARRRAGGPGLGFPSATRAA